MNNSENLVFTCTRNKDNNFIKLRPLKRDFNEFVTTYSNEPVEFIDDKKIVEANNAYDIAEYRGNELLLVYLGNPSKEPPFNKIGYYWFSSLKRNEIDID
jgi:hypothetical protein